MCGEWRHGVNMNGAKVVVGGGRLELVQRAAGRPCGVCGRGVGGGSV